MSDMNRFEKYRSTPSPHLKKIVVALALISIASGFGLKLYIDQENVKKADILYVKSKDQFELEHYNRALTFINQSNKLNKTPAYLKQKAKILNKQGKGYEMEQVLEQAIEMDPDDAHAFYTLGKLAARNGSNERAIERLEKAKALAPNDPQYSIILATTLIRSHAEESKIISIYQELIKKDPNYFEAWDQYSIYYENNHEYKKALKIRQDALDQFSSDANSVFKLAQVYDQMKNKNEAVKYYRKFLEINPMKDSIAAQRIFEITGKRVPLALEKMDSNRIPFTKRGNVMFISAGINDKRGQFLIDTGASYTVLYESKVEEYQIQRSPFKTDVETANGTIKVQIAYGNIHIGPYTLEKETIFIIPDLESSQSDGIIGMNVMNKFRMEVDPKQNEIILKR